MRGIHIRHWVGACPYTPMDLIDSPPTPAPTSTRDHIDVGSGPSPRIQRHVDKRLLFYPDHYSNAHQSHRCTQEMRYSDGSAEERREVACSVSLSSSLRRNLLGPNQLFSATGWRTQIRNPRGSGSTLRQTLASSATELPMTRPRNVSGTRTPPRFL